ncbi:hypothetical protein [Kitasatospora sp. DSM 101779]|uniref:hypothetical protein n=1 Tax=Kitasatospora sp. DSM 101779 TaxID=2853165 RepID=UPI0021D8BF51|nr:hypothetical protein [Kitasatospora sp. DSM 101779]MCU7826849.1 hypothetical protein [Kitasatospora sp. DSM 101779]
MTDVPSDTDVLPEAALAKLTELRDLAVGAVQAWEAGDRQAAHRAVTAATSAAATALGVLVALDRDVDRGRAEPDTPPAAGPVGHWWG